MFQQALQADNRGNYREAIQLYTKALARYPKNEAALYNRALCWYALDSNHKALADLNQLIAAKPVVGFEVKTNPLWDKGKNRWTVFTTEAVFQRGDVKYHMDSLRSAYQDFQYCIDNGYEVARSHLFIGSIYMLNGNKEKGCSYYQKAAELGDTTAFRFIQEDCR